MGLEGVFFGSRSRRAGYCRIGGVIRTEGAGEVLGTEEGQVVMDRKDFGFGVEVAEGGHLEGT